mmetsp:Transcript_14698/g.43497  ORF Transcript_14698/g.43497 Transcript_14698/m.43497 type:complete len:86 (+) Transcript_14698:73-330(+)
MVGELESRFFEWNGFGQAGCDATSNSAEYAGLVRLLRQAELYHEHVATSVSARRLPPRALRVEGDSELVIKQVLGEYAVDNLRLK